MISAAPESLTGQFETLRRRAKERYAALGLPTTKDEEWRFTSLRELSEIEWDFNPKHVSVAREDIPPVALGEGNRLVFVNGHFDSALSDVSSLPAGVKLRPLSACADGAAEYLGKGVDFEEAALVALNTAAFSDGYFLSAAKNTAAEEPLYILFISTEGAQNVRNILHLEEGAQVSVVESYVGLGTARAFINSVSEGFIGERATVNHTKLQLGSENVFHITTQQWHQGRDSNAKSTVVTLGGKLVRNDTNSILNGERCECTLNGLYVGHGDQHIDNHTKLDHAQPHCPSHELFKGVLDDKASAVFNGKIFVRQIAQKTDSKQSNMNLLLSDDAIVNAKPQLEIFADDVRCTHGATIGRLDDDAMFYLRSRGIPETEARNLLIYAFASDVIDRIGIPELADQIEEMLFARLAKA